MSNFTVTDSDGSFFCEGHYWYPDLKKADHYSLATAREVAKRLANNYGQPCYIQPAEIPEGQSLWQVQEEIQADPRFVSVYMVTRCYGGPEEGGWWYDSYELRASLPIADYLEGAPSADEVEAFLRRIFGEGEGNRFSVLGGYGIHYCREYESGQSETKGRPTYE